MSSFHTSQIEFAVVGGYAMAVWGYARFTEDLDILISNSQANLDRVRAALQSLGYSSVAAQIGSPGAIFRIGRSPFIVDFLHSISGLTTQEVMAEAVPCAVNGDLQFIVPVISLNQLRINKAASGRPKDLSDLAELPTTPQ